MPRTKKQTVPLPFVPLREATQRFWSTLFKHEFDGASHLAKRIADRLWQEGFTKDGVGADELDRSLLTVTIGAHDAVIALSDGPTFRTPLFPPLQQIGSDPFWKDYPPLREWVESRAVGSALQSEIGRLVDVAVGAICTDVSAALRVALGNGRLEAQGVMTNDPLKGPSILPTSIFNVPALYLDIANNQILPGAPKIVDVKVRRPSNVEAEKAELLDVLTGRIRQGVHTSEVETEKIALNLGLSLTVLARRAVRHEAGCSRKTGPKGTRLNRVDS